MGYLELYDLETYLFDTVRPRFHEQRFLDAFDFFCIVVWKANRAKSRIARRLRDRSQCRDLEGAVKELTEGLAARPDAKQRLGYLLSEGPWGFRLPMASAILTVLWPDDFTVYDQRVCGQLEPGGKGRFHHLVDETNFEKLWDGYLKFTEAVRGVVPEEMSLRDKDRYLFGKSFHDQLKQDICRCFGVEAAPDDDEP